MASVLEQKMYLECRGFDGLTSWESKNKTPVQIGIFPGGNSRERKPSPHFFVYLTICR